MSSRSEQDPRTGNSLEEFRRDFADNLCYERGTTAESASAQDTYWTLAVTIRDRLADRRARTARANYLANPKFVYYLSAEYMLGRQLRQNALYTGTADLARQAVAASGFTAWDLESLDVEPGPGPVQRRPVRGGRRGADALGEPHQGALPERQHGSRAGTAAQVAVFPGLLLAAGHHPPVPVPGRRADLGRRRSVDPNVDPEHRALGLLLLRPDSPRLLPRHLARRTRAGTPARVGRTLNLPPPRRLRVKEGPSPSPFRVLRGQRVPGRGDLRPYRASPDQPMFYGEELNIGRVISSRTEITYGLRPGFDHQRQKAQQNPGSRISPHGES